MKRIIIVSKEYGIFIGEQFGFGFWSKIDPVGQDRACTFETKKEAVQFIVSIKEIQDAKAIEIEIEELPYATLADIAKADLPIWSIDNKDSNLKKNVHEPLVRNLWCTKQDRQVTAGHRPR